MSWLKFELSTHDKPEVWQIAQALGIDPDAVVGKLLRVWAWFDQHTTDGTNAPSVSRALLDRYSGVSGFTQSMIDAGWMTDDGKTIGLPNFDRHNGMTAKTRAQTAKRVAKLTNKRTTNANTNAVANGTSVSSSVKPALAREEKIRVREEESISLSQGERDLPVGEKPKAEERLLTGPSWLPDVIRPRGWEDRPEVTAALERWVKYCSTSPHGPSNQIKLEDNLKTLADAGCTPERFSKAVTASIASGWKRIYEDFQKAPTAITGKRGKKPEEADRYSRADRETLLAAMLEWGLTPKDKQGPEPTFQSLGLQPMEGA